VTVRTLDPSLWLSPSISSCNAVVHLLSSFFVMPDERLFFPPPASPRFQHLILLSPLYLTSSSHIWRSLSFSLFLSPVLCWGSALLVRQSRFPPPPPAPPLPPPPHPLPTLKPSSSTSFRSHAVLSPIQNLGFRGRSFFSFFFFFTPPFLLLALFLCQMDSLIYRVCPSSPKGSLARPYRIPICSDLIYVQRGTRGRMASNVEQIK